MRVISVTTYVPSLERVSSYELGKKHTTSFLKSSIYGVGQEKVTDRDYDVRHGLSAGREILAKDRGQG